MNLLKRATLILALISISINVSAQKNFTKEADKAYDNKEYYSAIELYKKAYTKVPGNKKAQKAEILFKTAQCYKMIGDLKNQEGYYSKAIKANYPDPIAILYLADAKKAMGKYDEALIEYNNYKAKAPNDPRGENGVKSAELSTQWKDKPTRHKIENIAEINSKELDFSPSFADKKYTTVWFTSTREGVTGGENIDQGTGDVYSDVFETKVDKNGKWSTPVPITTVVNTKYNEGTAVVGKKGMNMFFTRCEEDKNKVINCQLWMAAKKGNNWDAPVKLPFSTDSFTFRHPAISADEMTLVFSSDMPGGVGQNDLWMTIFDKKKREWGTPVNLGPSINTAGNEAFPYLHDDGSLYYASNTHIGMGGYDMFKAEKKGENKWGEPENLKYPLNSAGDDFGIIFEGAKERGYFSSNREGGKGGDDIYSFMLPPLIFTLEGMLTDCENKIPIEGVTVKLLGSDGFSEETKSDKAGYYKFTLKEKLSYTVSTDALTAIKTNFAERYLNSNEKGNVTTVGEEESKTFKKDFCLIPAVTEIKFPAVLYDLDKATLKPESKDSLDDLYATLIENPTIVIELSSHTDSRATDSYNQKLSQARAQSCVDYLISKGIPKERLVPKGYGESRLKIKDAQINKLKTTEEKEAAHAQNRRTVFKVLRWDYSDPNAPKVEAPKIRPKVTGEEESTEEEEAPQETPPPAPQPEPEKPKN